MRVLIFVPGFARATGLPARSQMGATESRGAGNVGRPKTRVKILSLGPYIACGGQLRRGYTAEIPATHARAIKVLFPRPSCGAETVRAAARHARCGRVSHTDRRDEDTTTTGGFFLGVSPPDPRCSRFALGTTPRGADDGSPRPKRRIFYGFAVKYA
jgi:hypothetical protein